MVLIMASLEATLSTVSVNSKVLTLLNTVTTLWGRISQQGTNKVFSCLSPLCWNKTSLLVRVIYW